MSSEPHQPEHDSPPQAPPGESAGEPVPARGQPLAHQLTTGVSWLAIATLVLVVIAANQAPKPPREDKTTPVDAGGRLFELQAKSYVGLQFLPEMDVDLYAQAQLLDSGPIAQRLRFIVLAGELADPAAALQAIATLRRELEQSQESVSATEAQTLDLLARLYSQYDAGTWSAILSREEEAQLKSDLGWFGELALVPEAEIGARNLSHVVEIEAREKVVGSTLSLAVVFVVANLCVLVVGGLGLGFALMFGFFFFTGRVQSKVAAGSRYTHVYIETFALWFLAYFMLQRTVALFVVDWHPLQAALTAFSLSLVALLWPRVRRVPLATFTEEVGLSRGRHPLVEFALGVGSYCAMLPAVVIVTLITLQLVNTVQQNMGGEDAPNVAPEQFAHPIVHWIADGDSQTVIMVLVIAVVAAPLIEELMFRGLLYRHLRDLTARWRIAISVAFSCLANALIFAIIHPQGWLAVAPLAALATGCCILREWRGSLIAPITLHFTNNLVAIGTCILIL